ncbi:mitochondrial inner membrane protease subunit 2-like [Triticum urartu]|uniref:Mitochondrial inner membrane protease subunit 2 n=1 Tax=Triticum urartu TaxID=4572 RepID=A0A8R7TZG8_TRIUA|nr:mitochondrial inner membrane protease subunit 2-like [Triticum urartu]
MARARPSSSLWSLVKTIGAGVLSVDFPIRSTGLAFACGGPAMLPTLDSMPGDLLLVDRRRLDWFRGDVVAFRSLVGHSKEPIFSEGKAYHRGVVSRLIALPGDLIRLRGTTELLEVPEGHCWVEGDNPSQSKDSRTYGPVPLELLEGTVTHIIWPPHRMAAVPGRVPEERVRLIIDPAGSAKETTGIAHSCGSVDPRSSSTGGGGPPLGSRKKGLCRSDCNFIWFV